MNKNVVLALLLMVSMAGSMLASNNGSNLPNDSQLRAAMLASASPIPCTTGCAGGLFEGNECGAPS